MNISLNVRISFERIRTYTLTIVVNEERSNHNNRQRMNGSFLQTSWGLSYDGSIFYFESFGKSGFVIQTAVKLVREESQYLLPPPPTHTTPIKRASISFSRRFGRGHYSWSSDSRWQGKKNKKRARERTGSERVKAGCCSRDTMPRLFVSPEMTPTRVSLLLSKVDARGPLLPLPLPPCSRFLVCLFSGPAVRAPAFTN
ncbi:hypothetical protein CDAR_535071 [Caerostris darwini]|uniref:Uncharacterized protein n=1 Tax=Caerostris darwini TaxID=1538125 RepID=A0AAV4QIZ3_9ARAC|nr:hypothetical protein CDAR_535071 [Caerostris darwini]